MTRLVEWVSARPALGTVARALNHSRGAHPTPADTTIGPAEVVRFDALSPLPTAIVSSEAVPGSLILPVIGHLELDRQNIPVWITRASDYLDKDAQPRTLPADQIGLSNGVWVALRRLNAKTDTDGLLIVDSPHTVRVAGALASDLPGGNDVHVAMDLAVQLGRRGLRRKPECLLSTNKICAPVRIVGRTANSETSLRAGMLTRALFELRVGDNVQLSRIPRAPGRFRRSLSRRARSGPPTGPFVGVVAVFWGAVILAGRLVDVLVETALRILIRAPGQSVRVVQAHPGDDSSDRRIVRLHPSVFPVLGITPGMQVFVQWGRERTIAIALEDYQPHSETIPSFLRSRQAAGTRLDLPGEFPPHLVARVSLSVRYDLGMSSDTVAIIRRRLRTAVLQQMNQLSIPVAGLLLAALAVPDFRGWHLYGGLALVVILGLLPLRKPPPPRGRWP